MATQNLFDNDNSGSTAELDANWTQTFDRINKISTTSDTLTAGTFVVHFDASMRAIFGHTSGFTTRVAATNVTPTVQQIGGNLSSASIGAFMFDSGSAGSAPYLLMGRSRSSTFGSHTVVTSGDALGRHSYAGSDGTQMVEAARVQVACEGTISAGGVPGQYRILTADSTGVVQSAALWDSSQNMTAYGSVKSTSATSGVGYATGAGGTVTQATSKSTGVTLNTVCGQITMNAAALAADTAVSFTLTNSAIAAGDRSIANHVSGGTFGAYMIDARSAAGSATVVVRNLTAGSLSEAVVIGFAVIKGVTA